MFAAGPQLRKKNRSAAKDGPRLLLLPRLVHDTALHRGSEVGRAQGALVCRRLRAQGRTSSSFFICVGACQRQALRPCVDLIVAEGASCQGPSNAASRCLLSAGSRKKIQRSSVPVHKELPAAAAAQRPQGHPLEHGRDRPEQPVGLPRQRRADGVPFFSFWNAVFSNADGTASLNVRKGGELPRPSHCNRSPRDHPGPQRLQSTCFRTCLGFRIRFRA